MFPCPCAGPEDTHRGWLAVSPVLAAGPTETKARSPPCPSRAVPCTQCRAGVGQMHGSLLLPVAQGSVYLESCTSGGTWAYQSLIPQTPDVKVPPAWWSSFALIWV